MERTVMGEVYADEQKKKTSGQLFNKKLKYRLCKSQIVFVWS